MHAYNDQEWYDNALIHTPPIIKHRLTSQVSTINEEINQELTQKTCEEDL